MVSRHIKELTSEKCRKDVNCLSDPCYGEMIDGHESSVSALINPCSVMQAVMLKFVTEPPPWVKFSGIFNIPKSLVPLYQVMKFQANNRILLEFS